MNRKIFAALLASSLLVACENRESVVPAGVIEVGAHVSHGGSATPYLFAIPQHGNEVLWGSYLTGSTLSKEIVRGISGPVGLATASSGELFVGNKGNDTVTGYASPLYPGKKPGTLLHTISPLLPTGRAAPPIALTVDASSDVFVLLPFNVINEYVPPDYREAGSFTFPGAISSFLAANHHLFAAALAAVCFYTYPRGTLGINSIDSYSDNDPTALALDANNNLYAADASLHKFFVYAPNYQSSATMTFNYGACCRHEIGRALGDQSLLVSSTAYVYLVQRDERIVQYDPPDYVSRRQIDSNGKPRSAALDAQGNLLVANGSGGISIYQVPAGTLLKTISSPTTFKALATFP